MDASGNAEPHFLENHDRRARHAENLRDRLRRADRMPARALVEPEFLAALSLGHDG